MRLRSVVSFSLFFALLLGGVCRATDLALVGAKIYPSPTQPAIENGSIILRDGRIFAVGSSASIKIPREAKVINCKGLVVTAGFWNSHVHILTPGLLHAEKLSPEQIDSQLREMLTGWGFTTVFDIASVLENTNVIRRRMRTGEVKGPRILTVGEPFWVKTPVYVNAFLAANQIRIPEGESATQARRRVHQQIIAGADGIKIFANSVEQDGTLTMPLELARTIVEESHGAHRPVFAHVSNHEGIEVAIQSGADIMAHTTPIGQPWTVSLVKRMIAAHMALTPTLTLWDFESKKFTTSPAELEKGMEKAAGQLKGFSDAGGQVLFGTDVGYTDHFDTAEEFVWMSRAGMSFEQILASMTTNPADRFGYSQHSGRIAKGMDADLVVLRDDPEHDVTAFSRVRYTIRRGEIIYSH
jgi:imidazolonepropionase-like amidohydrolase